MFDKQPVDNMINAITFANDLSASATVEGDQLVIENFNLETMVDDSKPNKVNIPINNGMVSQKAVEQALNEMGAYLTYSDQ